MRLGTFTLALLVPTCVGAAAAQNNSLFASGGRSQTAPATADERGYALPSDRVIPLVVTRGVMTARQPRQQEPAENLHNPTLLAISPISVGAPEPKKLKVNDLITVIVRQTIDRSSDAKLKSEKDWQIKSELTKFLRLDSQNHVIPQNFVEGTPGVDFTFDNQYEGKGGHSRKDSMTTRITAKVIDIKPNGTLVLEAKNRIKSGEEEYIVTLTGQCRSEDVTAQNTVLSTQLYDLNLVDEPTGAVRDASRRGWLMRGV